MLQVGVGLREMPASEETSVGGQRRGVGRCEYEVLAGIDKGFLGDGVAAPEEEDDAAAALREFVDGCVGEGLPSVVLVTAGLVGTDGECGVEEQDALVGPAGEGAGGEGYLRAEVAVDLFDDVDQRGWNGDALRHREAESHGLSRLVIGILTEDDGFDLVERRAVEGVEYLVAGRITGVLLPLGNEEVLELGEVGRLKLRPQHFMPTGVYLYSHNSHTLNQEGVVFAFVADGAVFAVAGEHQVAVGQCHDALFQFLDQQRVVASRQVGASDAALKEGVAGGYGLFRWDDEAEAAFTVAWHIAAFDVDRSGVQQCAVVGVDGVEVVHPRDVEAHHRAVGLGLTQQLEAVAVHRHGQVVTRRRLSQAADVVHVGVCQQQQGGAELLAFYELEQLRILVGGFHGGVDDGAFLRRLVIDHIAVDTEMVESELFYHNIVQ